MIQIIHGECIEEIAKLANQGIKFDAIIVDPPYQKTQNKWDSMIPLDLMWEGINQIIKPNTPIIIFGSQPFTSKLILSNEKMFKYCWIWNKSQATGHLNAWKMPMRKHEDICVFYSKQCLYNPQICDKTTENVRPISNRTKQTNNYNNHKLDVHKCPHDKSMPTTVLNYNNSQKRLHQTEKPIELMEYLVKTYTNQGDLVLDFCAGSFTTGLACKNLDRSFIGIEKELEYINIGKQRLNMED